MRWFWRILALLITGAAIADAVRYLKGEQKNAPKIYSYKPGSAGDLKKLIFVYNANGGIFPGIADFIHKEFFPSSYPCNLCYQTFGTFSMKDKWKNYLDNLSLTKSFLHKDDFKRKFEPNDLPLPVILASDGKIFWVHLSASELNQVQSLESLISLMNQSLQ